jgi:glycosyltransferase involved in cell wall biosynthesis
MTKKARKIFGSLDPFYEQGEVMGRSVANQGFMDALLGLDPFEEYHFFVQGAAAAGRLERLLANRFPRLHARGAFQAAERLELAGALKNTAYHCFHLSDCINHPPWLAAARNALAPEIFPVTSLTHSLSYARYPPAFMAHLWPGTTPRDCIVATSRAAQKTLAAIFDDLRTGYGLDERICPAPAVERIPLGVDVSSMTPPDGAEREQCRAELGFAPEECVLLVFGRISQHSKMDLLPLLRALQRAPKEVGPLRVAVAGFGDEKDSMTAALRAMAENVGLAASFHFSPDEAGKARLFKAADVFVSPADNPQETFGITVLEAGAFGLPAVVSDYDGYRDLVSHGETGLLVPTVGLAETPDVDLLAPLLFDTQYHLHLAQRTAVDVGELAGSIEMLAGNPGLRMEMGRKARLRIEEEFSWGSVAEACVKLWEELWSRPVDREKARSARHPLMLRYGRAFAGHPSRLLNGEKLAVTRAGEAVYRGRDHAPIYQGLSNLIEPEALRRALFFCREPLPVELLVGRLGEAAGLDPNAARIHLAWCLKHGLLEIREEG